MRKTRVILLLSFSLTGCATNPTQTPTADTRSAQEHVLLGSTYEKKGDIASAAQQYQRALTDDPKFVPALMSLGALALTRQDWSAAESYFNRVLKISPFDAAAINNLAMVDLATNTHLDNARMGLDSAIPTAGPLQPYLYDTLAIIAVREGRWTDANQALQRAAGTAPANNADLNAQIQETRDELSAAVRTQLKVTH